MKVQEIFDLAVKIGIKNDPRGPKEVADYLKSVKKDYAELPKSKQKEFDKERLTNPYSDSRILAGEKDKRVKRVLVGIDIGTGGVLLAKELERQGKKIDLIIAHHPAGKSLADLHEVMDLQTSVYSKAGVPENIAEGIVREQMEDVSRKIAPVNHYESPMAAELLSMAMINIHTPADNCVWNFVEKFIAKKNPKRVGELIEVLKEIPEYKKAIELGAGPVIFSGSEK